MSVEQKPEKATVLETCLASADKSFLEVRDAMDQYRAIKATFQAVNQGQPVPAGIDLTLTVPPGLPIPLQLTNSDALQEMLQAAAAELGGLIADKWEELQQFVNTANAHCQEAKRRALEAKPPTQ